MAIMGSTSVHPASPAQQRAWDSGVAADPEEVADGVWAIASPIPQGSLPATLTYVLVSGDGSLHLIDPGWGGEAAMGELERSLAVIGHSLDAVETVIATHFHPDHLGLCAAVREQVGARVILSSTERAVLAQETASSRASDLDVPAQLTRWGVPSERQEELLASFGRSAEVDDLEPDVSMQHGDRLEIAAHNLEIIETPGHTGGHACLVDHERHLVYSGDHVLPRIFAGIGLGTLPNSDPLNDYFTSLDRLAPMDNYQVLPGHEFRFHGLEGRRQEIVNHHLRRTREVAALVPSLGDAPVWEYARQLTWTAGWEGMRDFWLHSALRQTELHKEFVETGRAERWLSVAASRDG